MAVKKTHEPELNRLLAFCLLTCTLLASAAPAQQELPDGISLLEDRGLATKLDDARAYLAEQRWEEAVGLLQEIADADPSAVIAVGGGLFRGAAHSADTLLAELPNEALAFRRQMLATRGQSELQEAMNPPDLVRLTAIAHRYRNTPAGDSATAALAELWRDRGYQDLAALHGAEALPPTWEQALPTPDPRAPFTAPVFKSIGAPELPHLDATTLQPAWTFAFDQEHALQNLNHRMAFGHGLGFATNGREVVALELGSGLPRWHFRGPAGWQDTPLEFDHLISGGASPFTLLAPVLADGILLAVVQEPIPIGRSDNYSRIDIRKMMPARRLYAFDARSGRVLWRQDVRWINAEDRQPYELAASPPAVAGGKVYLPIYSASGTVDLSLLCLDLRTGERLWKSFLTSGTMETNLFGNILSELACPPPVATLERVFVCSHFGTVCAIDANNGQAVWTRTYRRTDVRTRQNGNISPRPHYFRNNPLAFDGKHLVVAPLDSLFALAINASDGRLLDLWQAVSDSTYGTMAHLIGMDRNGAWFSGTNIVHQPFSDRGNSRLNFSQAMYDFAGVDSANLHPGVITQDGVLAMSMRGAAILDPDSLVFKQFAVDRQTMPHVPLGPIQAIHGMVMFMTSSGVSAMVNPESLLDALAARNLDSATLRELLLMLESANFASDRNLGKRLARTAEKMAGEKKFAALADDLHFLASRTWLVAQETRRGLDQLGELLDSNNTRLRTAAASLVLDVQSEVDPQSPRIDQAIQILLEVAPAHLLTRNGSYQPFLAALERTEALAAMAGSDLLEQHDQLIDVLLLEDVGGLEVRNAPLQTWARRVLNLLLEEQHVANEHQRAALAKLEQRPVSDALLRAFADTAAMQDWLRAELDRNLLERPVYKRLLRWVYDFGAVDRAWPEVKQQLTALPTLPQLPTELTVLNTTRLRDVWLLNVMEYDGAAYAFLQAKDQNRCHILRMDRERAHVVQSLEFIPGLDSLGDLRKFCHPTKTGLAIVYQGRWLHIRPDGTRHERMLGADFNSTSPPKRIGELAAVLLRGAHQMLRVELIDLETGVTTMAHDFNALADRFSTLAANDRWMFLLQDKSRVVHRLDLHHQNPAVTLELPFVPTYAEILATRAFGTGVAMPTSKPGGSGNDRRDRGSIVVVTPEQALSTLPLNNLEFGTMFTKTGIGWSSRPARSLRSSAGPLSLNWLAPGESHPWSHTFPVPDVRVAQISARPQPGLITFDDKILALHTGDTGLTEVHCLELGASAELWTRPLEGIPFAGLSDPFATPLRAADGWAILLRENDYRRQATRLHAYLLHEDGTVRGNFVTLSNSRSRYGQQIYLLNNLLLLRNGELLTLLGKP